MNRKKLETLVIAILIPLAVGFLSSLLSQNTSNTYETIIKPDISPPGYLFPIVWTILYILMGISSYLIYTSDSENKTKALNIYAAQLIFNFFWSIIFFRYNNYLLAFVWLLILIILIIAMIKAFYEIKPIAGILQIFYLLWCLFAAYLNLSIYLLNR